jgi:hypothetical protein
MQMAEKPLTISAKAYHGKLPIRALVITLVLLVSAFVIWQAASYAGLFRRVAEWQFATFGQWLPAFTLLLFFLIPLLLVVVITSLISARNTMLAPRPSEALGLWRVSARRFQMRANRLAVVLAVCAIGILALGIVMTQGGRQGYLAEPGSAPSQSVVAGPGLLLVGQIDEPQSATLALDLLFFRRDVRYAPVIEPGTPDTIRYFAELPAVGALPKEASRQIKVFDGEAPGPIRTLYRNLGYQVSPQAGLIDSSTATIQWPYFVSSAYLGIAALVAFVIALIQAKRIRRAEKLAESGEFKDDFDETLSGS